MGEPAELSDDTRDDVRRWATTLIKRVAADESISWDDMLCAVEWRTGDASKEVGASEKAYRASKETVLMAQLERAQLISESISRVQLADALESEVFAADDIEDPIERAKREGWNLATMALVHRLRQGWHAP